jgi:uncharacterized membrane protein (UPF0127 family)
MPLVLFFVAIGSGCIGQQKFDTAKVTITTSKSNVSIYAEIADNPVKRTMGLMNRSSLDDNAGMLFIFDNQETRSFWMKDTLIPLDILFIDSNYKIVDIQTMQPCTTITCPRYTSAAPAKYALEVNAGFAAKNSVEIGDSIKIG